jgi:hypothetical protein
MLHSRRTHALALAMLVALFMFGGRARAVEDPDYRVLFGPVGITPGERALVNVYAIGNPDEIGNPNELPWTFVVRVFDRRGLVVQEQKLQLAAGMIGAVAVAIQDEEHIPGVLLSRRTFRAEIVGFNPQPDPPGKWTATLEIIDRLTARTRLVIGNPDVLPAESLAPPGAAQ